MKNYELSKEQLEYFIDVSKEIVETENFQSEKQFIVHGKTTLFEHSIRVAYLSYCYAINKNLIVDFKSLIRGALLHDYYLYDWHKNKPFTFHGLNHNKIALKNAMRDFNLNKIEQNIILSHMFPLTLFHIPKYKEAFIVSKMDKNSAMNEHNQNLKFPIDINLIFSGEKENEQSL